LSFIIVHAIGKGAAENITPQSEFVATAPTLARLASPVATEKENKEDL
jgi:hypothetical protein